jgi:Ala-tRNA(Pro) deacylase
MDNCLDELKRRFESASISYEVIEHRPVYTAQEAAAASGVSGYSLAKAVVMMLDERPHLCVLPAAETVDFEALRSPLGAREVRLAREDEFSHLFPGCDAGAIPPLRMTSEMLPVHIDRDLTNSEWIVFETGTPDHAVRMKTEDYLRLAAGNLMQFGEGRRGKGRQRPRPARTDWGLWLKRGATGLGAIMLLVVGPKMAGRVLPNRTTRSFAVGAAAGAAAAVLADPRAGARRRALLRDRTRRTMRRTTGAIGKKRRYMRGRMEGARHEMEQVREALS